MRNAVFSAGRLMAVVPALLLSMAPRSLRADQEAVRNAAAALDAAFGVRLVDPGSAAVSGWTEELVSELRLGLEALPPAARRFPGGPLEVALLPAASPFGMGDGSGGRPEWADGRRRFLLYAYEEPSDSAAWHRLGSLTRAERERLWRRRAMVHAVVRRWDDARGWSDDDRWRRLTGWLRPFDEWFTWSERSLNTYSLAFSRARGQDSAALDLATFAEEALVPAESVRADALPVDETVRCQKIAGWRFLHERLSETAPEGARETPRARGACPALDAWVAADYLDHLEILFAAPSGRHAASIFGHLFVRGVRKPGAPPGTGDVVVEIAAVTGVHETALDYMSKGLTGGFQLVFSSVPWPQLLRENVEVDQRDIRRFRLELSPEEARRVLERIWELERTGYFEYFFFNVNCASMLAFLLDGAVDPPRGVGQKRRLWAMPTAMLDELAEAGDDSPLLTRLPIDIESTGTVAERSTRLRREALAALVEGVPPARAAEWRRLDRQVRDPDPVVRRHVYSELRTLLSRTTAENAAMIGPANEYLRATLFIERHQASLAQTARDEVEKESIVLPPGTKLPTADELVERRRRGFLREDAARRAAIEFEGVSSTLEIMSNAPRRPLTRSETKIVRAAEEEGQTFKLIGDLQAEFLEQHFPNEDPFKRLERDQALRRAAAELERGPAIPSSGSGRLALGGGMWSFDRAAPSAVVGLRTSVAAELIGDHRLRGMGARTGLRLLDGETAWEVRKGWPRLAVADVAIVGLTTLPPPDMGVRRGLMERIGWDVLFDYSYRAEPVTRQRSTFRLGGASLLAGATNLESYSVLSAGATVGASSGTRDQWEGGVRVASMNRLALGGHTARALSLELEARPYYATSGFFGVDLGARLVQSNVLRIGGEALLVSPSFRIERDALFGSALSWMAGVSLERLAPY